ncbi:phosphotransferase family protein [Mycolicibacter hiberniae]|uniref:Aminoglycoside phosphotransferase n=1 Tax=Mycolicibacter hiberniae TaxID=29314 RepID=A0A7I7WVZ6_9MYCO|nr:aminoglycoside phosphotransferase family protein [Mycolicibacter hiberniae]MCV7086901.1 aminoglycoside phosphotransferase family protein [Mycolicibacter hiberniae]ORV70859.1 aminoglycoside phosphotransferase [Mycolicibacter hiberniae]BBZ21799.1 aminoglycoside phosphotransferase [Mycolicibacter hiberniae]
MNARTAIPRHPRDVTSQWLSTVLSARGEPVEVASVDVVAVGTGQTGATYRVLADYRDNPAGLPGSFVIKLPAADDAVRDRVVLGYRSECAFYQEVAARVKVPIPQCFHCDINEDATEYALLLADRSPAVQGDQIAGCDPHQARLAVTALAGLHAPTWCDQRWLTFSGLAMSQLDADGARGMGDIARMCAAVTVQRLGAQLGDADCETLTAALDLITPWLSAPVGRFALIHGDYRLDNMLFSPDGEAIWVVDWQTLGVGLPARDLAFFTGTSVEPELRNRIEADLVAEYHSALLGHGVTGYDRETCWQDYRFGALQVPLICALGLVFATGTDRGDDMFVTMLRRGCQAIRDLGTLELVVELAGR